MNYAEIKYYDIANGSGVRVSLFVSGCTHRCKNCFNEIAWDFNYGNPYTKAPFNKGMAVVIALVIGFVFAFIVTGSMKGQLKSVKMQKAAANYQRNGSLSLINSTDYFLYSTVSQVKKESNNSNSGSVDSHGGSSRKF